MVYFDSLMALIVEKGTLQRLVTSLTALNK
jgi:hypothetical protein